MFGQRERARTEREDRGDGGLIPLGSLTQKIGASLKVSASTPAPSETVSETIGRRPPASGGLKLIGGRPGETGAVAKPRSLPELLAGSEPEETDRSLRALLTSCAGCECRPVEREWVDPKYGLDFEVVRYEFADSLSSEARHAIAERLAEAFEPADERTILAELTRLKLSTKARAETEDNQVLALTILAEECAEWPADVVRAALRRYARRETWFPSLAEIRDELQRVGRRRRLMAEALQ